MARFVMTDIETGDFVGFDEIGGEATEASHVDALGTEMTQTDSQIFASLAGGVRVLYVEGLAHFRAW